MGFRVPVRPLTVEQLDAAANPSAVAGGQSEAIAKVFYDTQQYEDNVTTELSFFQTLHNDKSLGNMEGAGQLPDPQFFQIYYFGCDILYPPAPLAVPQNWLDTEALVLSSRAYWQFTMSDKGYGWTPLSFCHASGGITGFGYNAAAVAATATEYANNGTFDGGFCVDGSIIIPPKIGFQVSLRWPAAVDIVGNKYIRFWMAGVLHRRVL